MKGKKSIGTKYGDLVKKLGFGEQLFSKVFFQLDKLEKVMNKVVLAELLSSSEKETVETKDKIFNPPNWSKLTTHKKHYQLGSGSMIPKARIEKIIKFILDNKKETFNIYDLTIPKMRLGITDTIIIQILAQRRGLIKKIGDIDNGEYKIL